MWKNEKEEGTAKNVEKIINKYIWQNSYSALATSN